MITISGMNNVGNVIHVIVGPETDIAVDIHGSAITDITNLVRNLDPNEPVYLSFSKCSCETNLVEDMQVCVEAGGGYPFVAPNHNFSAVADGEAPVRAEAKVASRGACSHCGEKGRQLVPDVSPPYCYECLNLDMQLAAVRKSDPQDKGAVKPKRRGNK